MGTFRTELPEDVEVETITFIVYGDDRPAEVVMAGTQDEKVAHQLLTPRGEELVAAVAAALLSPEITVPFDG